MNIFGLILTGVKGVNPKSRGFIFDLLACKVASEGSPPSPPPENSENPFLLFMKIYKELY